MATTAPEQLGWSDKRWQSVLEAVVSALATTAKCRRAIPKGPPMIGEKAVVVPSIVSTPSGLLSYGDDRIETPVQIYSDVELEDQHSESEADLIRLIEAAAALVGSREDMEIVNGDASVAPKDAVTNAGKKAKKNVQKMVDAEERNQEAENL